MFRRIKVLLALWSELLCLLYDESKNQKGLFKIPGRHHLPEEKRKKNTKEQSLSFWARGMEQGDGNHELKDMAYKPTTQITHT